jgi:uncharacterized cupin superfamily protein
MNRHAGDVRSIPLHPTRSLRAILQFRIQMINYRTYKLFFAALGLIQILVATPAQAETVKPVKQSKGELAGSIFHRSDAVVEIANGNVTTDVSTFKSQDAAFETGLFKSGPVHEEIKGQQGLEYNEFLYFISGSATLTSADGSAIVVSAGESVVIPKGWTGSFDSPGYTKMYATYNPFEVRK